MVSILKYIQFFCYFFISENKHFSKFLAETLSKDPEARATVLEEDEVCYFPSLYKGVQILMQLGKYLPFNHDLHEIGTCIV